jgi:hypothetical protein
LSQQEIQQSELRSDVATVQQYESAHPDAIVSIRADWGGQKLRYVVLLSADQAEHHEAELLRLVEHPDRLAFERSPRSRLLLETIRGEIQERWRTSPDGFGGLGLHGDIVAVSLRADQEVLAAELIGLYGDGVRISLGSMKPYPPNRPLTDEERKVQEYLAQPPAEPEVVDIAGLDVSLELADQIVISGHNGNGRVVLANASSEIITFASEQPLVGSVIDPDNGSRVGGYVGGIAGTGLGVNLRPDETTDIRMTFGTAATWELPGYALPAGRYLVQTEIAVLEGLPVRKRQRILVPPELMVIDAHEE